MKHKTDRQEGRACHRPGCTPSSPDTEPIIARDRADLFPPSPATWKTLENVASEWKGRHKKSIARQRRAMLTQTQTQIQLNKSYLRH